MISVAIASASDTRPVYIPTDFILDNNVNLDDDVNHKPMGESRMVGMRQFDEEEVIATALDVFWRKGLHDATMQDLATATGVQRGSLYNAYGDKEAIFLRAFDHYAEEFLETAANALAEGDAAARLKNFFNVIIVNMTSGSPPRGCLTTRTALDVSSTAVRQRVQGLLGRLEQLVSRAITTAPGGRLAIDANRLARVVVTFTRGLAVMERAGYSRKQLKEAAGIFVDAMAGTA
jgi:TetR/AcrR family transcriptional repressor of nem operon